MDKVQKPSNSEYYRVHHRQNCLESTHLCYFMFLLFCSNLRTVSCGSTESRCETISINVSVD
jgi:hypothetical protein